ncbi:hypothetical protein [Streptomyces sp. NPDC014623]|uniref:hypothetical protein n=1 Tax=Streptomyces sp. NPDC014623 TaxID=3364875 RepID=UPI0036F4FAA5
MNHTYLTLTDRHDRTPAVIPGASVPLDGALLRNMTYALLLHNNTLPTLAKFWKAADDLAHGSTTDSDLAVLKEVFAATPMSPGIPADNQATMFMALTCGDAEWPHEVEGYGRPHHRRPREVAAHRGHARQHLGMRLLGQAR